MKGNQIPRIRIEPNWIQTDGAGASMLMNAYGVKLDEWQELVLNGWLAKDSFNNYMIRTCLEKTLISGTPGVADFGAGHSVYNDEEIFRGIKEILSKFKNIVLLLPTPDIDTSLEIMARRSTGEYDHNEQFIRSHCNRDLATMVVYENGRTPREVAEGILKQIEDRENQAQKAKE